MKYAKLSSYEIGARITGSTPIILPIGAVEAHGPHLPLETDNILVEQYADKISERIESLVLPVLPFGQVWSLKNFPGNLTLTNTTLTNLVCEIGESLYQQGSRIFVLVSGHLGNMTALKEAARKLFEEHDDYHVLHIFYPDIQKLSLDVREGKMTHSTYIHACEIETSLMLYLSEKDVDMTKAIDDPPVMPLDADYTPTPWEEFTETAVLGEATLATKDKGKYLVEKTLDKCAAMIELAQKKVGGKEVN